MFVGRVDLKLIKPAHSGSHSSFSSVKVVTKVAEKPSVRIKQKKQYSAANLKLKHFLPAVKVGIDPEDPIRKFRRYHKKKKRKLMPQLQFAKQKEKKPR